MLYYIRPVLINSYIIVLVAVILCRAVESVNPFGTEFRKNSFNPVGKLQLFRSVKLIETHGIMKITKKFTLYKIE